MKSPAAAWLLALTALCGCGAPPPDRASGEAPDRVIVLGLDGVDPDVVGLLAGEGRLPNFARLAREGASGRLTSAPPLLSPILWTTVATGREPLDHGVSGFVTLDADGKRRPVSSRQRRVRALWNMLSESDRTVAVVGWWATWPAEEVRGAVLSDRAGFHFLLEDEAADPAATPGVAYPADLVERLEDVIRRPDDLEPAELRPFARVDDDELARSFAFDDDLSHLKWAVATALAHRDVAVRLWREERPDLMMVYVEAPDTASHLFGHLFRRRDLAGELAAQRERFGGTVEAVYELADRIVGALMAEMDAGTTLVVLSDHGFELGALHADPSRTRDLRRVSHRHHEPEGILYLYGRGVRRGARIEEATLLDVAPTVLALLGLPPSREMPGRVLTAALEGVDEPERIATWEGSTQPGRATAVADSAVDDAAVDDTAVDDTVLEKLRALGYLDGNDEGESGAVSEAKPDRNRAALALRGGRPEEAAAAYSRLVELEPDDALLRAAFASALSRLGRAEEAFDQIDVALRLDPASAPAFYVRGQIKEGGDDVAGAVADYRTAVLYDAEHEPSLAALDRLGVPPEAAAATTPEEVRATLLLRRAKSLVERGDYAAALAATEEARQQVPDASVVYQYLANIHHLRGDRAAALAALERAIELDPGNAQLRKNLEHLRGE